jgi:hypothetical protein
MERQGLEKRLLSKPEKQKQGENKRTVDLN